MPIRLNGSTSGYVELHAPAVAGSTVLTLPTDTITPGLVLVASQTFSAASSVSVNNCFTSAYENYRVVVNCSHSALTTTQIRLRASGVDASGSNYYRQQVGGSYASAVNAGGSTAYSDWQLNYGTNHIANSVDVYWPQVAGRTRFLSLAASDTEATVRLGLHDVATSYDGFTLYPSTGTITGSLYVYGYRKA